MEESIAVLPFCACGALEKGLASGILRLAQAAVRALASPVFIFFRLFPLTSFSVTRARSA